jgi:hypothetical protein
VRAPTSAGRSCTFGVALSGGPVFFADFTIVKIARDPNATDAASAGNFNAASTASRPVLSPIN